PSEDTASPAESYPRYSSRRSPSRTTSSAKYSRFSEKRPAYPTIPHIGTNFTTGFPFLSPRKSALFARIWRYQEKLPVRKQHCGQHFTRGWDVSASRTVNLFYPG